MESSSPAASRAEFIAAIARPGDTVIIAYADRLDQDEIASIAEYFRPLIETGIRVDFTDGVSGMVVVRPGTDDEFDKEFPA